MEEEDDFFVVFTSMTSKHIHVENTSSHFIFNLDAPLDFSRRHWDVRMVNITIPKILEAYTHFYICMRGIGESVTVNQRTPILAVIPCPKRNVGCQTFHSDIYTRVRLYNTMFIEMYIIDELHQYVSFEDKPVTVTLHFKRTI